LFCHTLIRLRNMIYCISVATVTVYFHFLIGKLFYGSDINGSSASGDTRISFLPVKQWRNDLKDSVGDEENRSRRQSYVPGKKSGYIYLLSRIASLSNERVSAFFHSLSRFALWLVQRALPIPPGKWIRDGHGSLGNSEHNLSDQEGSFSACQSDALRVRRSALFFFEDYSFYSPPTVFIPCFFLLSFLLDCVGEDT
jgi:hypothetical protein